MRATHTTVQKPTLGLAAIIGCALFILASVAGAIYSQQQAGATSLTDGFKAGKIIDDAVFTNHKSMSVSQIQSFLESKVATCHTNGVQPIPQWVYNYGNQPPFTCLKDYTQNGKKASQIIYDVAQKYRINPQVFLVLLQKEQSLVTDTWPVNNPQYKSATGYGCPDNAPCDSAYYGLTNQLDWAGKMFRSIMDNVPQSQWYTPYVLGNNYIQYNPSASCGGSVVNIENRATQALYNYTPYQPNQAALNAGWGAANCGAYGNRNFYMYFKAWFGDPTAVAKYGYSVVSQELYSDANYTTKIGSNSATIKPGEAFYVKATVKNTGNQTWYREFLRIGTTEPQDRISAFRDSSWLGGQRPTSMQEPSVSAGEQATFRFKAVAPQFLGVYSESFSVLLEGQRWIPGAFKYDLSIESPDPYYSVEKVGFDVYKDASRTQKLDISNIDTYAGSTLYVTARMKNTGNRSWPSDITKIATTNPPNRSSQFSNDSWPSHNRPTVLRGAPIEPGATGVFDFSLTAPSVEIASITEQFGLVIEGQRWLSHDIGAVSLQVRSRPPSALAPGEALLGGEALLSTNEQYRLIMQGDGNLVLYDKGKAVWHTRTNGSGANRLVMQGDGNLVLYDKGKAVWHTRTNGSGRSTFTLQSDRNLVIYKKIGGVSWASYTHLR